MPDTRFTVNLGGKERPLKFSSFDGVTLKRRFDQPVAVIMKRRILGLDEENRPTDDQADIEAQIALLHLCLNRGGWNITEELLHSHVTEYLAGEGHALTDLLGPAVRCAYMSGAVTGYSYDLVAATKKAAESMGISVGDTKDGEAPAADKPGKGGRGARAAAP